MPCKMSGNNVLCPTFRTYASKPEYRGELCGGCMFSTGERRTLETVLAVDPVESFTGIFPELEPFTEPITKHEKWFILTGIVAATCVNCGTTGVWTRDPKNDQPGRMAFRCDCGQAAGCSFRAERTDLGGSSRERVNDPGAGTGVAPLVPASIPGVKPLETHSMASPRAP